MRSRAPRHAVPLACLTILALLFSGCGSSSAPSEPLTIDTVAERGPYGAGVITVELVDTSRPTEPNRDFAGRDERTLVTEVWYPAAPDVEAPEAGDTALFLDDAPYPLIVFSHGLSSSRRLSASYTQHLASHGYVVAAPDFPLSSGGAPGGPRLRAVINQPEDVSFVIDSMLAFGAEEGHLLEGAIDDERIGLTGHSLGALTTYLTAYGPKRDERAGAALPVSIPGCFFPEGFAGEVSVPIMLLVGRDDLITAAAGSNRAFHIANPPKYGVEIEGGEHIRFADIDLTDQQAAGAVREVIAGAGLATDVTDIVDAFGGGDFSACASPDDPGDLISGDRQRELLRTFATPFFAAYLRDDDRARQFLEEELPGLVADATFEFETE